MEFIVVCARNWAIGKEGQLLFHLPGDMSFFKETTINHVVVMGRKTYESFPGPRALPKRNNIVLTRQKDYTLDDAEVVHDFQELKALLQEKYQDRKIFLIGGGSLYRDLLEACEGGFVTHVDAEVEADTFFPNLNELPHWRKDALMKTENEGPLHYEIWHYKNTNKGEQ